ncbi:MAG: hypothetical protein J6Z25_02235 [Opitutales bacterium]|nr:hypothetical protein [Opitutales bacterium]
MLVSLLIFFLLFGWMYSCLQQIHTLCSDWKILKKEAKEQGYWINQHSTIQDNVDKFLSKTYPEQMLSSAAFTEEVENLVHDAKITCSIDSPDTHREGFFDEHALSLHCENATLEDLIEFEKNFARKIPYSFMEKIELHANEQNPKLLEAECSLKALQIRKNSLQVLKEF